MPTKEPSRDNKTKGMTKKETLRDTKIRNAYQTDMTRHQDKECQPKRHDETPR